MAAFADKVLLSKALSLLCAQQNRQKCLTMTAPLPSEHPTVKPSKIGVLLLNLGTPDATDYWSVRRYLREFLSETWVTSEAKGHKAVG